MRWLNSHRSLYGLLWLVLTCGLSVGAASLTIPGCQEAEPGAVATDQTVPALVGLAQSYHVQADIAVEKNDLATAELAMRDLVDALAQQDVRYPETAELGLDAYTRLARILVDQNKLEDALAATDQGLEFGGDAVSTSIFGGYLQQTRGNIQRALGDDDGAVESHVQAIVVFKSILDAAQGAVPADSGSE